MKKSLVYKFSDKAFEKIVSESFSYKECMLKLGYNAMSGGCKSGSNLNLLKRRIQELNLSVDHFKSTQRRKLTYDMVFCKDSDVSNKVLRRWFTRYGHVEYICDICGQKPFWKGKPMTLILDHKNGYNTDNRVENLHWVCPNCNAQLDTTNGKNINHGKRNKKYNFCLECGKEINCQSSYCKECSYKIRAKHCKETLKNKGIEYFVNREVNREELKSLIREKSMLEVGKSYGISDNGIRKWCKKYELPYKKTEINKISDEDWEKI